MRAPRAPAPSITTTTTIAAASAAFRPPAPARDAAAAPRIFGADALDPDPGRAPGHRGAGIDVGSVGSAGATKR